MVMKKTLIVAFCLLFTVPCFAYNMEKSLARIESEWFSLDDSLSKSQQKKQLQALAKQAAHLSESYPDKAEPQIVQACLLLTIANLNNPFSALSLVDRAKKLLMSAIDIDPDARYGSAVYTLGTLYFKLPGWPISFGNDEKAEKMLQMAIKRIPDSVGGHYFYGQYLLEKDRAHEAETHFRKAIQAHIPDDEPFKKRLQNKAHTALNQLNG